MLEYFFFAHRKLRENSTWSLRIVPPLLIVVTLGLGWFAHSRGIAERLFEDRPSMRYVVFAPLALALWISGSALLELRSRRNETDDSDSSDPQ